MSNGIEEDGPFMVKYQNGGTREHYCEICGTTHPIPSSWTMTGTPECPSFTPSFGQYLHPIWDGRTNSVIDLHGYCHYIITNGIIHYQRDCTHAMAGKSVPMVEMPEYFKHHYL